MTILRTALSGALAARVALDATSQNIANSATPGYTRQGAAFQAVIPGRGSSNSAGDGVKVSSLLRFSDGYKNQQLWRAASQMGEPHVKQAYLTQLEQVMGSTDASLGSGVDAFFAALNAASVEPASNPLRQQVVTAAGELSQRFNSLQQVLSGQRSAVALQRGALVDQVSSLSGDIAQLNDRIAAAQASRSNASGLIDERDQKIDALSKIVAVQVVEQADGTRNISMRGGQPLVAGAVAATLRVESQPNGDQLMKLEFARQTFPMGGASLGGELGGLAQLETDMLVPATQTMVQMATALADRINTVLGAGYDLNGQAGAPMFIVDATGGGALLSVNPNLMPEQLGFSGSATQPGGSENLLALIGVQRESVSLGWVGNVMFSDAYTQMVGKVGSASAQNQAALETAGTVRVQAQQSWASMSGVNEDEEAINLIQYQQMYEANMKVIAVANQLFDSTLAMMS